MTNEESKKLVKEAKNLNYVLKAISCELTLGQRQEAAITIEKYLKPILNQKPNEKNQTR
jgi:hypothetical protein